MTHKLWTKNFTIITVGSLISTMGNAVSNFALGLIVFNATQSTFLYSLFMIIAALPKIIIPLMIGPFVDRRSRKNIIVTIDTIYGFIFAVFAYIIYKDLYSYPLFVLLGITLGTLDSIYNVAYESLYPEFITEGNFSKAYSISSLIYPIATTIMVPVAGFAYESIGVAPLFLFNGITFFITQAIERFIVAEESHLSQRKSQSKIASSYKEDFKEGIAYLKKERGLMSITAYFCIATMAGSITQTLYLPFFTASPDHTVTQYSMMMAVMTFGRCIGGLVHYRYRYPADKKYTISVCVYLTLSILNGMILFMPYFVMLGISLIIGILGVTSYNIRISGTQNYVPNEKRGRFNGIFMMATMAGSILGQFVGGILGEFMPIPYIVLGFMAIEFMGALGIMLKNREHVKLIYNQSI